MESKTFGLLSTCLGLIEYARQCPAVMVIKIYSVINCETSVVHYTDNIML